MSSLSSRSLSLFRPCYRSSHRPLSSSVSPSEVLKFSQQSSKWWDPRTNPLVGMNPIRLRYMLQHLSTFEGLRVLDVGCGGGLLSESLARLGASQVLAIDPSTQLVEMAKTRQEEERKPTRRQPLDSIEYRGGIGIEDLVELAKEERQQQNNDAAHASTLASFDVICILEVLEHVEDVERVLQSATTLLRDGTSGDDDRNRDNGGILFVSTLNRTLLSYLTAILGAEYIMGYLPRQTHNWNQFLTPSEIEDVLRRTSEDNPSARMEPLGVQGLVLEGPPPPIGTTWNWKLDPHNLQVNWIGAYQKKKKL